VTGEPLKEPGFHEKVLPATLLLADKEEDAPLQIVAGEAEGVTTGLGFTTTVVDTGALLTPPTVITRL
jgi:hypothetical protein